MLTMVQRTRLKAVWRYSFTAVLTVLLAAFSVAGVNAWKLSRSFDTQVEKIADAFPAESTRPHVPGGALPAQNMLFLGVDTGDSGSATAGNVPGAGSLAGIAAHRADTFMVVHVQSNRGRVYIMAVLQDSLLDIPGHGKGTIGAALAAGGVPLAVQTVENLLGVRMDHVAVVDFEGFRGVTDVLGGATVDNPAGFVSTELPGRSFAQGLQHLDGAAALAFIRERSAFASGGGDERRVRNQQILIEALLGILLRKQALISPGEISDLVAATAPHLAVDEDFTLAYMATYGAELRSLPVGDIRFFTLPTERTAARAAAPAAALACGEPSVRLAPAALAAVRHAFQADALDAYLPSSPKR
jgi:LCP family protein required for cell wall assembly